MDKAMYLLDKYTWVLTNLCSWVSTISQTQVLISFLLYSSSSPLTCIMVCDLVLLGQAHLTLLLKLTTFSTPPSSLPSTWIGSLSFPVPLPRPSGKVVKLSQRAALPSAKAFSCLVLTARTDKVKLTVSTRDTWKWLMEESSSRLLALSKVTLVVVAPSPPRTWCAWWREHEDSGDDGDVQAVPAGVPGEVGEGGHLQSMISWLRSC